MRLKRRSQPHSGGSSHGIDLAPMLDFVINLLIFFIITAVFVKTTAVEVSRPTGFEQPENSDSKSVQIQILESGDVWMDNREIDVRAIRANVERASAVDQDTGVLVVASEMAPTHVLVSVVDQVHLGGIYNITFTTSE
ncbi:MAG: biopolymer transporter ExbD [Porticoccaceae bacterium]